jgi:hypothetical protein
VEELSLAFQKLADHYPTTVRQIVKDLPKNSSHSKGRQVALQKVSFFTIRRFEISIFQMVNYRFQREFMFNRSQGKIFKAHEPTSLIKLHARNSKAGF